MTCIKCNAPLAEDNWPSAAKKNWVNKCLTCIRAEKKEYAARWRAINPRASTERAKKYAAKLRASDPVKLRSITLYSDIRKRAIKNGWELTLTTADIYRLLTETKTCRYCGWEMTNDGTRSKTTASIDRIDSSKGYVVGNVQIISLLANTMKSNATEAELLLFAKGVLGLQSNA